MRMCQDQISCKKYFAHVLPRCSRVWNMPQVSRFMHMHNVRVVDFDMRQFGHPVSCPHEDAHELAAGGTEGHRSCPSRKQHPARETDMSFKTAAGWAAVNFHGNPCRHRRPNTRRSRQDDCILDWETNSSMKPQLKRSRRTRWPKSGRKGNTSEAMGLYEKVLFAQAIERTG